MPNFGGIYLLSTLRCIPTSPGVPASTFSALPEFAGFSLDCSKGFK
jgi:hypothetical protein